MWESSGGLWEMPGCGRLLKLADARDRSFLEVGCGFGFTVDLAPVHECRRYRLRSGDLLSRGAAGSLIHNAPFADVPEARGRQFDLIYASGGDRTRRQSGGVCLHELGM